MLKEFENLFKETGGSLTPECNKEHASFLRRLYVDSLMYQKPFLTFIAILASRCISI